MGRRVRGRWDAMVGAVVLAGSLGCQAGGGGAAASALQCDDSLKREFTPDAHTTVLSVARVARGQAFPNGTLEQMVYPDVPPQFEAPLCQVKLLIGPPNPGPEGAPSTSRGIGIEVWLPEKAAWNGRIHNVGGSGSANGGEDTVLDRINSNGAAGGDVRSAPRIAAEEGAVSSTTDSGQQVRSNEFWKNPDGSFHARGVTDWNYRALHEQAVKTKALATAYYGTAPTYSYFDGGSGGGRQALHVSQNLPEDYDGILARVAIVNWTAYAGASYPTVVIQNDLDGRPLTPEQMAAVSNAAVQACDLVDGTHLGFILDHEGCRYDPTRDAAVLCAADGGANRTNACLTRAEARAVNKFWYGSTADGGVPDPAVDNGWKRAGSGEPRRYGVPRGTNLTTYARPRPNQARMTYGEYAAQFDEMNRTLRDLNTDRADLSRLKASGHKLIHVVNYHDDVLFPQWAIDHYERVLSTMGGPEAVQSYFRFYVLPGLAHGAWNGTMNPLANPPVPARGQLYQALVDWVEHGQPPDRLTFRSGAMGKDSVLAPFPRPTDAGMSLPLCAYPARLVHVGGDIRNAESYACR